MIFHFRPTVNKLGIDNLSNLANILEDNDFMMGTDKPTLLDCTVFGFLSGRVFGPTGTSEIFQVFKAEKRFENLIKHTERMREKYWPDWEECKVKK